MEYGGVLHVASHPSFRVSLGQKLIFAMQLSVRGTCSVASIRQWLWVRVNTFLGSGWGRLLSSVPVIQCRKQKDGRHAGQSASDKENAVGMNEAVRGAQLSTSAPENPFNIFPSQA